MEWLWVIIAMAIAGGITFLITKYGLSGKIGDLVGQVDVIQKAAMELYGVLIASLKADDDGVVRLTADEVTAIKNALAKLLALFGINLPM